MFGEGVCAFVGVGVGGGMCVTLLVLACVLSGASTTPCLAACSRHPLALTHCLRASLCCVLPRQVTSRAVGILQPLVLGWTSLASSGLLPKGLNTARSALQVRWS